VTARVIIVIPCYNEASRFPLHPFLDFAAAHPHIRFLLVNDGSRDDTLSVLNQAAQAAPGQVSVLNQPVNRGKGEAVRAGFLAAMEQRDSEAVGFWDADLATPLEQIDDLTEVLLSRPELAMVFGARVKLLGRNIERRPVRHYLGRVFATVVSIALRLPIYDTQCGAKVFRVSEETRELFDQPFTSRWVFDVEILARFIRRRRFQMASVQEAIYEYPLPCWRDVAGSQVRPKDFFRAFWDVVRIYRRYMK
jgi:glycosyltransferase involved in cell wall biosynthesis